MARLFTQHSPVPLPASCPLSCHFGAPPHRPGAGHLPPDKGARSRKPAAEWRLRPPELLRLTGKRGHLSRTWLASWALTTPSVSQGVAGSKGAVPRHPRCPPCPPGSPQAAALGKPADQKGLPSPTSDFSHFVTCFPSPAVMEKVIIPLHRVAGEALNVSNRATGDGHKRPAPLSHVGY